MDIHIREYRRTAILTPEKGRGCIRIAAVCSVVIDLGPRYGNRTATAILVDQVSVADCTVIVFDRTTVDGKISAAADTDHAHLVDIRPFKRGIVQCHRSRTYIEDCAFKTSLHGRFEVYGTICRACSTVQHHIIQCQCSTGILEHTDVFASQFCCRNIQNDPFPGFHCAVPVQVNRSVDGIIQSGNDRKGTAGVGAFRLIQVNTDRTVGECTQGIITRCRLDGSQIEGDRCRAVCGGDAVIGGVMDGFPQRDVAVVFIHNIL